MDLYKTDLFKLIEIGIKKKTTFSVNFIWKTLINLVKALYQCHKNDIIHFSAALINTKKRNYRSICDSKRRYRKP